MVLLLCLLTIMACGCTDSREAAVSELEQFTEHLEQSSASFTDDDWATAQHQFADIVEELDNYEYTDDELKHIGKLKGKCTARFARAAANDLKRTLHRWGKEAEGFIDALSDSIDGIGDIVGDDDDDSDGEDTD